MPEIVGYWEDEPVYGEKPEPIDPTPFTREARLLEVLEHELKAGAAAVKVGKLVVKRQEVRRRKGR